ncbi:MAG: hypothetical protein K2J63_05605, partial [Muribaculaceae bacterium]|nr:hypothetical protein [Muribaculaceae bacterium]
HNIVFTKTGYTTEQTTASVVAGKTISVNVQMNPTEKKAAIELNPSSLNFGTNQTDLSVTITNNGNSNAEWSINLGNNNWLSVSEMAGSIQPGRTQSLVFTVDRNYLSEQKSVVVNFHAFGNSYPLTISCAPGNAKSEMSIEPKILDFGSNDTEKNLTIRNTGTTSLNWTANDITEKSLTLSASEGTVAAGGSSVIKVMLDRNQLTGQLNTTFTITDGVRSEVITVTANGSGGTEIPSDIVETKGLRAYFPFNGNLDDLAENTLYGFVNPEATYINGVVGGTKALSFSRKDETTFSVNDGMIDRTSMSVCFWIKNIDEGNIFWVTSSNESDGHKEMMCLSYTKGQLRYVMNRFYLAVSWYDLGYFTHKAINDGEWHHIALVSDFNNQNVDHVTTTLYVDGIQMDSIKEEYGAYNEKDTSKRHFDTGVKFSMGGANTPNMSIANLRTYTLKLTANQIKAIYEAKQ